MLVRASCAGTNLTERRSRAKLGVKRDRRYDRQRCTTIWVRRDFAVCSLYCMKCGDSTEESKIEKSEAPYGFLDPRLLLILRCVCGAASRSLDTFIPATLNSVSRCRHFSIMIWTPFLFRFIHFFFFSICFLLTGSRQPEVGKSTKMLNAQVNPVEVRIASSHHCHHLHLIT